MIGMLDAARGMWLENLLRYDAEMKTYKLWVKVARVTAWRTV